MIGFLLLAAHAFGDFPLQNDWMQAKSRSTLVCFIHICAYSLPFQLLYFTGWLPFWAYWAIMVQHFLQDRFALHLKWMRFYKQTPPNKWPVGPLAMDQAWHISFLGLIAACLLA
jgi:NADH:ubiquinone oxidoreductase subunit H